MRKSYIDERFYWMDPLPTAVVCPKTAAPAQPTPESVSAWARRALNFQPDPVQTQILDTPTHRLIVCCTRQWGKTSVAAIKALHFAWSRPNSEVLFASASLNQSAEMLRLFRRFALLLTGKPCKGDGIHGASTILPNASRIVALPQSPRTVRGHSAPNLIVVDEAAFVDDEMHNALTPMLAASNGQLWLMSSPNAQSGEFYKIWHGNFPEWKKYSVTATDCPRISPEFLASERRLKGETVFRREYLCEFVAGARQVIDRATIENAFRNIPTQPE